MIVFVRMHRSSMSILARQRNLQESHSRDFSLEVRFELLGGLNVVYDSW